MKAIVDYRIDPVLDDTALNDLFARAWPDHVSPAYGAPLERSLGVVAAFVADRLIGFVNLATDGGAHSSSTRQRGP